MIPPRTAESNILYHKLARPEPSLEHHQHPNHRSVIPGVSVDVPGGQLVYELGAHDAALLQVGEAVERELPQRTVTLQPRADRKAESVLGLRDDLVGQKPAQRFLEEV